jgi:uncharacterized membrane protein
MDQLLFHAKIVHLPMALAVLMPLITGGVALAWWRGWLDRRVWLLVLALQGILVGSGLLAMNTGETEEERVEEVVPEAPIEAHEEAAEAFVWASAILLALMVLPLFLLAGWLRTAALTMVSVGSIFVLALGYRTGEAGGRLVYEHGAAQAYVEAGRASSAERVRVLEEYEDEDGENGHPAAGPSLGLPPHQDGRQVRFELSTRTRTSSPNIPSARSPRSRSSLIDK